MRQTKLLFLFILSTLNALSQQTSLTENGNKISLNFLSLQGGTISGTLTVTAGIRNIGTFTNTGNFYNAGNVGIGNTAPTQALDVTGIGRFSGGIINSGNRSYFGKDGANLHWLASTDAVS